MEKNTIKKALYKQKPIATQTKIEGGCFHYETTVELSDESTLIKFKVPVSDMGDATFGEEMQGQLLIRWIVW